MTASVCLNMIVKNEEHILKRCLDSAINAGVDDIVIADTGSTDATKKIIEDLHGKVVDVPFHNFGQARNDALAACRQETPCDYILFADADHEFVGTIDKALLTGNGYEMRITDGHQSYWRERIVHRDVTCSYVGVTHEYLSLQFQPTRVDGCHIVDHANGSNRKEKFARDIALLLPMSENGDPRSMFYLARSYYDLGNFNDAKRWFVRRACAGGWDEEVWYALFMEALCCVSKPEEMQRLLWNAYNARPWRGETLYYLAKSYREGGYYDLCCSVCEIGSRIKYPTQDKLFIEDRVYRYGFAEEMSIAGFYSSIKERRDRGFSCCKALAEQVEDVRVQSLARRNLRYYEAKHVL